MIHILVNKILRTIMKLEPHLFMPGHTVEAIIKKLNRQDVSAQELRFLVNHYKIINGDAVVTAGTSAMIPILDRHAKLNELYGKI